MTDNTQPLALMLADRLHHEQPTVLRIDAERAGEELRRQHARIAELEAQLEAIGAGGVSGPLMGQPQAMPSWMQYDERTDVLTIHGKRYAAGMFGEDGFLSPPGTWLRVCVGAEDCVTLSRASLAVSAGSEPVAKAPVLDDPLDALRWGANVAETLLSIGRAIGFGRAQQILGEQWDAEYNCAPRGRMGVTAKDVATCQMCGDKPFPGCNSEFQGEAACRFTHPSPPEGMVGGWISVDERLPEPNVEVLCAGQGWGNPFVTACYYDDERREWYPINTHWTDSTGSAQYPTHWTPLPPPPTTSAGSEKGE